MNVIEIENLWKEYRLGVIGHGTLVQDMQSWWAKFRGKEDPNAKISSMLSNQEKQIEGDRFWALRNLNLKVKRGEVIGIIGRNGAGKSTLLKILSRVTAPTQGNIKIKGRIASLLEVGTGFHPELTGRQNIFMNGSILGMSKQEIRSKLDEIIDFSGVETFIDTPVKRYSSGMYVRLAFAVAAHLEPEILIVDEVLAVGDADFQEKAIGKMEQLSHQESKTVLLVSHSMLRVQALCKRAILIDSGQIIFDGAVRETIEKYLESSASSIQLEDRADRLSQGTFKFTNVEFIDALSGKKVANIICGQALVVKIHFISKKNFDNVDVAFAVFDINDRILFSCLSSAVGKKFSLSEGNGCIECVIPKFPVSMGTCYFNLNAKHKGSYLDLVKRAGKFNVISGDYFGTGVLPAQAIQSILIEYNYIKE